MPAALSIIAGVTDVTSWLLLGGFFSAHVTGNLVVMAADVITGTVPDLASMLAIPVFVVTTVIATAIARRIGLHATLVLLSAQAALLVIAALLAFTTHASENPKQGIAVVIGMLAVCAMATQNAYLHLVPVSVSSTAVMTGNLVTATVALTDMVRTRGADPAARVRWADSWPLLAGFLGGCLLGAVGATLFSDHAATIPALLAAALVIVVLVGKPALAPTQTPSKETVP
jgi:uncharacterized membrane protein YoaK (UPF0700 family)